MDQRVVRFATNRIWDRQPNAFGFVPEAPADRLWLGTVRVGVSADPRIDGACSAPDVAGFDDFRDPPEAVGSAQGVLLGWLAAARVRNAVPLLYVHGFDYDFAEACARAGNLCDWYEAAGIARFEPLAFTWPSNGIGNASGYKNDQTDCAASGPALARLIAQIGKAAAAMPGRRPAYLAHSMGARCTRFAMRAIGKMKKPPAAVFGPAVVVAGDDDTDAYGPPGAPLEQLSGLAETVTIGIFPQDATLSLVSARVMNGAPRLGADGPARAPDPASRVFVVDYAYAVADKPALPGATTWNDTAHQYYRNDDRVRRDLVPALAGIAPDKVPGRRPARPDPRVGASEKAGRLYVDADLPQV
jgi:esterase/lipase superfamily enzyme